MTLGFLRATVTGITIAFVARARRLRFPDVSAASGAASLASGLATSLVLIVHIISVALEGLAAHEPVVFDTEQIQFLALGIAILIPALVCLSQAKALKRGELHAQKRTLAASIVIAGLNLPAASVEPLSAWIAALAIANIGILLVSRTNLQLNEPVAS